MPTTCPTCAGSYDTNQPGGVYLHACAPVLSSVKVLRAGATQTLTPDKVVGTDTVVDLVYTERLNKIDQTTRTAQTKGG